MSTTPQHITEPRQELIARDVHEMTAELWRLRNDYFDKFGLPEHADRADALRQFLWDNKTGICAALARPAQGDKTAALQDSAYIAGLGEGFRLGLDENHEGLAKRITARDGYLASITRPAPEDDSPGTPLARLKGIADFVIANGLCTGIEAKPPELFLIEAFHACHDEIEALRRFLEIALDEHENHFGKINADKYPNIWTVQARKRLTTKDVQK